MLHLQEVGAQKATMPRGVRGVRREMMVYPEALHPGPAKQKKRGALGGGPPKAKSTRTKPIDDGMSELYTWFSANGRTLEGCPMGMRDRATTYVKARIRLLETLRDVATREGQRTNRLRTQLRWLRRWASLLTSGGTQ